ncbi:TRAP transporter small permease subunit [Yunchengibacter salinarum]|uniref:TRAP transporter small permease subunit n=1 Tax=Yunchengibacter salinarum TaxID=3133399 RepID=UPI0035B6684B
MSDAARTAMARALRLARALEATVVAAGRAAAWLAIALMLVIVVDVGFRKLMDTGSTRLQELEWHLHGLLFLFGLGWAYLKDGHVRVTLLSDRFRPGTRAGIEALGGLFLLLPYVAALVAFGADYAGISLAYDESSPSPTGLANRWLIKYAMLAGFALLGLAGIARTLEALVFLTAPAAIARQTRFHPPAPDGGDGSSSGRPAEAESAP